MIEQYPLLSEPTENGAIKHLWMKLYPSSYLRENISECFRLYELYQTMILSFVEDERVFNALSFIKSKLQNKLDKNLDTCIRLYVSSSALDSFPIERAVDIWFSFAQRRGADNCEENAQTEKYTPTPKKSKKENVVKGFECEISE